MDIMKKRQLKEGKLKGCRGYRCNCTCCDDDVVEEWINEYCAFHDKYKQKIIDLGIKIHFIADRVYFTKCSDGKNCKFLKLSADGSGDFRPIDCKIYPYAVDWDTIDFDKRIVKLYYWDDECPLARLNKVPSEFKKDVIKILKRDFALLFFSFDFKFVFVDKVIDHQYEKTIKRLIMNRIKSVALGPVNSNKKPLK